MKKVLAFFMTAVMVCSMGVTTAFGATAKASQDKVAVNGQQIKMQAYNINGYNYFKLRDLGEVAGFEVGWDAGQKCVNILSYSDAPPADLSGDSLGFGVPEEPVKPTMVYDSFYVDVNESVGYWYDNYVFFGNNVFVSWSAGGEGGRVKFTNCEFNCDLIVAGASEDSWVTLDNCVFLDGYGRYFAE